jgi:hypothetical protein
MKVVHRECYGIHGLVIHAWPEKTLTAVGGKPRTADGGEWVESSLDGAGGSVAVA